MKRSHRYLSLVAVGIVAIFACTDETRHDDALSFVVAGQSLIKVDPRQSWPNPFGSIRPIVQSADIAFTNYEMAVNGPENQCGVPEDYVLVLGEPRIPREDWPGNVGNPHAVHSSVMEFLSSIGFNLMSLANNHTWDLGECGVRATCAAADLHDVTHAGAGRKLEEASAPAYLTIKGVTVGLVAATTGRDERHLLSGTVNGVWTGNQDDWDRNIDAVREAASQADFVIYYQHFQIDADDFAGLEDGEANSDGHIKVDDIGKWQEVFAKAIIDAGASLYIGHGHRGFDGVEIYKGRPLFRQLGGFAYQGVHPESGYYDDDFAWWGLLARITVRSGSVESIEMIPLELDEGAEYLDEYGTVEYLTRRGFSEVATGGLASEILERFKSLSARYGTEVRIDGERASIDLSAPE